MIPDDDELDGFMLGAAASLDLAIDKAFQPGVLANLRTLRGYAALVTDFRLDDGIDAAQVFEP